MKAKVQGVRKMFNTKEIGKTASIAIAAALFGSTLILSAVGPARASETIATSLATDAQTGACLQAPATARYLA
jgi:hypothetical protein